MRSTVRVELAVGMETRCTLCILISFVIISIGRNYKFLQCTVVSLGFLSSICMFPYSIVPSIRLE
ncbi:hypothetical protein DFH27DRAFT_571815 [Peziza echinospora]|nr:hypothetical protein DFH27DRAFT_571815 [Peziza echinospora]